MENELKAFLAEAIEAHNSLLKTHEQLINALAQVVELEKATAQRYYVNVETLVEKLGGAFGKRRIMADLQSGYFKQGRDYVVLSSGSGLRVRYGFWPEGIRKVYELPPEKRRIY